jgi:hypothetical protein
MAVRKVTSDSTGAEPQPGVAKTKTSTKGSAKTSTAAKPETAGVTKPEKVSPAKAKAPAMTSAKTSTVAAAQSVLTPIRVHYNVGEGNRVAVRGDIGPFRWDRGIDAQNTAADIWEFQLEQIDAGQTFQIKPLINDVTYSTGDNFVGIGGQALDIYPAF